MVGHSLLAVGPCLGLHPFFMKMHSTCNTIPSHLCYQAIEFDAIFVLTVHKTGKGNHNHGDGLKNERQPNRTN